MPTNGERHWRDGSAGLYVVFLFFFAFSGTTRVRSGRVTRSNMFRGNSAWMWKMWRALTDARYDVWCISTALSHWTIKTALRVETDANGSGVWGSGGRVLMCVFFFLITAWRVWQWDRGEQGAGASGTDVSLDLRERMPLEPLCDLQK